MQTIKLVVGDWSGDGHNVTHTYFIEANYTSNEIEEAYQKFLTDRELYEPCEEYEDAKLDDYFLAALAEANIDISDMEINFYSGRDFCEFYLRVAKHTLTNLEWNFLMEDIQTINVGGYGLYE